MDHVYLSFLFLFFSYILSLLHMDGISLVLQLVLLVFFQYIYYTLTIHPPPRYEYVQNCVSCGKMTPQHYVHCSKCKKLFPTLELFKNHSCVIKWERDYNKYKYKRKEHYFPWEHVLRCPILNYNESRIIVDFKSPPETWKNMTGRAGELTICRKTRKQTQFQITYMN